MMTSRRQGSDRACPSPLAASNDVIIDDLVARRRVHVRDVTCSSQRQRHLFTSAGSQVRVHVTGNAVESGRTFLVHFEGTSMSAVSIYTHSISSTYNVTYDKIQREKLNLRSSVAGAAPGRQDSQVISRSVRS